MNGLKIVKVELTTAAAENIFRTALDAGHTHGIGYWANVIVAKPQEFGKEPIGAMLIEDAEEGGVVRPCGNPETNIHRRWITTGDIKWAVEQMLSDPAGTDAAGWCKGLTDGDYPDGPLADAIIQVAMFGKVIYG